MIVRVSLSTAVLFLMCGFVFANDASSQRAPKLKLDATKSAKKSTPKATDSSPSAKKIPSPQKNPSSKSTKTSTTSKDTKKAPKELDLLPIEKNIAELTNLRRKQHGLPPLEIDKNLVKSARRHAIWMARNRQLQHTSQPVAENIAMGHSSSQDVVRGWMNSSGHRANILNGSYRRIGTAAYVTPEGTIYWCQQFLR